MCTCPSQTPLLSFPPGTLSSFSRDFPGNPFNKSLNKTPSFQFGAWVRSLVGELRSHILCGTARKKVRSPAKSGGGVFFLFFFFCCPAPHGSPESLLLDHQGIPCKVSFAMLGSHRLQGLEPGYLWGHHSACHTVTLWSVVELVTCPRPGWFWILLVVLPLPHLEPQSSRVWCDAVSLGTTCSLEALVWMPRCWNC